MAMPDGKVVRARAIQPRPDGVPTTKAALDAIASGPSGGSEVITQGSAAMPPGKEDKAPGSSEPDPVPRGSRVTKDLLDKFELTKGCPKCESLRRGENRTTIHHSKECRKRIEELMQKDPTLIKKLSEVGDRQNRWLGRCVEAHDVPATPTPSEGQALEASANGSELEQLTVGVPIEPSGQGGEDQKPLENPQQKINMLERSINELKEAQKEAADEERQGRVDLCSVQEGSKYDIAELFSPVRMTGMAKEFDLRGGWSIDDRCTDPITGRTYGFRTKKDQNEVRKMIRKDRPLVLTVSPPCTLFSIANQGPIDPRELAGAVEMIKRSMEMCDIQRREGRYFVFEQPQGSRAWDLEVVKKMVTKQDIEISTLHQCMYGLKARDTMGEAPAYKPTRMMTNHEALAEALSQQCNGRHRHAQLVGKTACAKAAEYPRELCEEVLKAVAVIKKGI